MSIQNFRKLLLNQAHNENNPALADFSRDASSEELREYKWRTESYTGIKYEQEIR